MMTNQVFPGMLLEVDWEQREYVVVPAHLEEGPRASSSSELVSGAVLFLPLGSLGGSLMVKVADIEDASLRVLGCH